MKINSITENKSLGELNTSTFFCRCGMTEAGTPHFCVTPEPADPAERRRFYVTASTLILGCLVLAWAIVIAFGK